MIVVSWNALEAVEYSLDDLVGNTVAIVSATRLHRLLWVGRHGLNPPSRGSLPVSLRCAAEPVCSELLTNHEPDPQRMSRLFRAAWGGVARVGRRLRWRKCAGDRGSYVGLQGPSPALRRTARTRAGTGEGFPNGVTTARLDGAGWRLFMC